MRTFDEDGWQGEDVFGGRTGEDVLYLKEGWQAMDVRRT